jgi:ribosome-associated protein
LRPNTDRSQLRQSSLDGNLEREESYVPGDGDDGLATAHEALEASLDKKALEPVLLDMRGLCSYTNYILIVSGRSDRQVDAISDGVRMALKRTDHELLGNEGLGSGQWALLDFGDVIVHVFHHPVRGHYDLESLWSDAPRVPIEVPPEARATPDDAYPA